MSTVGVAPGVAALRLAGALGMRGLPSFLGACGRLVITEGSLTPLDQYRQSDWETRWHKIIENFFSHVFESKARPGCASFIPSGDPGFP